MKRFSQYLRKQGRWLVFATACLMAYSGIDANNYVYAADHYLKVREHNDQVRANLQPAEANGSRRADEFQAEVRQRMERSEERQEIKAEAVRKVAQQIEARYKAKSVGRISHDMKAIERLKKRGEAATGKDREVIASQLEAHLRSLQRWLAAGVLAPLPDGLPKSAVERHRRAATQMERAARALLHDLGDLAPVSSKDRKAGVKPKRLSPDEIFDVARKTTRTAAAERRRIGGRKPGQDALASRPLSFRPLTAQPIEQLHIDVTGVESTKSAARIGPNPTTSARELSPSSTDKSSAAPVSRSRAGRSFGPDCPNMAAPQELRDLAETLDCNAVDIFNYVHDNFEVEWYYGVAKGWKSTLEERRGNDFDQSLLLKELLVAASIDARLEWGTVDLPIDQVMNLTGIEDPNQAGSLIATAGYPAVLLMSPTGPAGVRMTHAWVKANVDYLPDRGAIPSLAPDTWIRLDPTFKQYRYTAGIAINGISGLNFTYMDYVTDPEMISPIDYFSSNVRQYFLNNGTRCETLRQVWKEGSIVPANYPYLPDTLPAKVVSVAGEAPENFPAGFDHVVEIALEDEFGDALLTYTGRIADLHRGRLSLTFPCASQEDCDTVAAYGSLWDTPAYLVNLRPTLKLEDAVVAEGLGAGIGAGTYNTLRLTFTQPNVASDQTTHEVTAAETIAIGLDPGYVTADRVAQREQLLNQLISGAADPDTILAEELHVAVLRYLRQLSDGFAWTAGLKQHRYVKRPVEGRTARLVNVDSVFEVPLSISPAEHNIDMSRLLLGMQPIDGNPVFQRECTNLAGAQSSWLENAVWEQTLNQDGISAVKALKLSHIESQTLHAVNANNVDAVLAIVDLGDDEDIISFKVNQGREGVIASQPIGLNAWAGTGYVLEDPTTGAATYAISGGTAGGSGTEGGGSADADVVGSEEWLLGKVLDKLWNLLGWSEPDESATAGDPVYLATGNLIHYTTDFAMRTVGPQVVFHRTYNSRATYEGPLGYGWTHFLNPFLVQLPSGDIELQDEDGTLHRFTANGSGYDAPPGKFLELTLDGTSFALRTPEGMLSTFEPATADRPCGQSGCFRLSEVRDPRNNTVTLQYDAAGNLESVVDAASRTVLSMTYDPGSPLIRTVTDHTARSVSFSYSGTDLTGVVDKRGKPWTLVYDSDHNLTQIHDPLQEVMSIQYDAEDRVVRQEDPEGGVETFSYDPVSRRTLHVDKRGNPSVLEFDERGRATRRLDALGNEKQIEWSEQNQKARLTTSRGAVSDWTYNDSGAVLTEIQPEPAPGEPRPTRTYEYGDSNWPTRPTILEFADAVAIRTYTTTGEVQTQSESPDGLVTYLTQYTYDQHGLPETQTDARNTLTEIVWDPNSGMPETITVHDDDGAHVTQLHGDPLGRIDSLTRPGGTTMTVTYTDNDKLETLTDPFGNITTFVYDDLDRVETRTLDFADPSIPDQVTSFTYDGLGRQTSETNTLGDTARTEYDLAGNVIAQIDRKGQRTEYNYDELNRLTTTIDPFGKTTGVSHCADIDATSCPGCSGGGGDGVCAIVDDAGQIIRAQELDGLGRVTAMIDGLGNRTTLEYDAAGTRIALVDPDGRRTEWHHDRLGRLEETVELAHLQDVNDHVITAFDYDEAGNLVMLTDAKQHVLTRGYNRRNQMTWEQDPTGQRWERAYDGDGQLLVLKQPGDIGIRNVYQNSVLIEVHEVQAPTLQDMLAAPLSEATLRSSYQLDASGRRVGSWSADAQLSWTYDALGRREVVNDLSLNQAIEYGYDANGNRASLTSTFKTIQYEYDARNRLSTLIDSMAGQFGFHYDLRGRRTTLTYPNGAVTSYGYDLANRLLDQETHDRDDLIVQGFRYDYDNRGLRTSKRELIDGAEIRIDEYGYDDRGQLIRVGPESDPTEIYGYDNAGNRTAWTTESFDESYIHDASNRLETRTRVTASSTAVTTYLHDDRGNLTEAQEVTDGIPTGTQEYTYDYRNMMTAVAQDGTPRFSYGYDADGRRVRRGDNLEIRRWLADGDTILAEYLEAGTPELSTVYTHGPRIDEPLAQVVRDVGSPGSPSSTAYLLRDGLGSVTASLDASGRRLARFAYAVYGEREASIETPSLAADSRYGFTGREVEGSSSMNYYRSRFYDNSVGRFMEQDRFPGITQRPISLNRFTYAYNDPVNLSDPSGQNPGMIVFGVMLALTGLLILGDALLEMNEKDFDRQDPINQWYNFPAFVTGLSFVIIGVIVISMAVWRFDVAGKAAFATTNVGLRVLVWWGCVGGGWRRFKDTSEYPGEDPRFVDTWRKVRLPLLVAACGLGAFLTVL